MMLSNTLLQIKDILKEKIKNENITESEADSFINFMKKFKKDTWIYPGVIKRNFSFTTKAIYQILNQMEKQGILKSYYELYCSCCQKSTGTAKVFNELPDTFFCELCNRELHTLENTVLIYQVVKDD